MWSARKLWWMLNFEPPRSWQVRIELAENCDNIEFHNL